MKRHTERFPYVKLGIQEALQSVPRGLEQGSYEEADAASMCVRGRHYLLDRTKYASEAAAFKLLEVEGFRTKHRLTFCTQLKGSFYNRARATGMQRLGRSGGGFMFVMHFDMHPSHTSMYFEVGQARLRSDEGWARCWERFLKMSDADKNKRLKLISSVQAASWIAKTAMGPPRPALIGTKLLCSYSQTEDLLECSCDVNSSLPAAAILQVALNPERSRNH